MALIFVLPKGQNYYEKKKKNICKLVNAEKYKIVCEHREMSIVKKRVGCFVVSYFSMEHLKIDKKHFRHYVFALLPLQTSSTHRCTAIVHEKQKREEKNDIIIITLRVVRFNFTH